jgi:hypothetical protein
MLEPIPFAGYMEIEEMNNEPVAWIDKNTGKPRMDGFIQTDYDIPLYTHPAKTLEPDCYGDGNVYRGVRSKDSEIQTIHIDSTAKTLTDEEILACWSEEFTSNALPSIEFAKAILIKAQQK